MKKRFTILKTSLSLFLVILGLTLSTGTAEAQYLDNLSDAWSKAPTAAYSTRKVMSTYSGPAMRLRRSSDNAEIDVFFDTNGWVSLASNVGTAGSGNLLVDWVGVYSAYVTKWYDQSGNGNHATPSECTGTITTSTSSDIVAGTSSALNVELAINTVLYDAADGTAIGSVKTLTSATAVTLNANATKAISGGKFFTRESQPRFINGGVIDAMPNGRPALYLNEVQNGVSTSGLTTPLVLNGEYNVNLFAVARRTATNSSNKVAIILGNWTAFNTTDAGRFTAGFSSENQLVMRTTLFPTLATTTAGPSNTPSALRYIVNAKRTTASTDNAGVVQLDVNGTTTTSAATSGAMTFNNATKLNLFRPVGGFSPRALMGYCPEVIYYASSTIDAVYDGTDATTLLSAQKTNYMDAVVVTPITIQVGASKTYTTIQAAYNSIPSIITEPYIIELQSDYNASSETFPITLDYVRGVSGLNTITIRPASGFSTTISGSSATQLVKLDGAKYVYIDGRAGGVGSTKGLTFENTNTAAGASTIWMANNATGNKVQYCTIKGSSVSTTTAPTSGTIVIGSAAETVSGYGSNTIDNCDIADASTGLPTIGVYLVGTTGFTNEGNIITNNNIYNFFNPGAFISSGIYNDANTNTTTITANKLYQTAARTYTGNGFMYPIYLNTAGGVTAITDNVIGYSSNTTAGRITINNGESPSLTVSPRFAGIFVNAYLGGANPNIMGNTISAIDFTSASTGNGAEGVLVGIYQKAGNLTTASLAKPNTISDINLYYTASHTANFGLAGYSYNATSGSANFSYTYVHGLSAIPIGTNKNTVIGKVIGIYSTGPYGGSGKINKVYNLNCGVLGSTVAHIVQGISLNNGSDQALAIERNLVYNLNAISTGTSIIIGIAGTAGTNVVTYKNNMVALGNDVPNGADIRGIHKSSIGKDLIYNNSIYIGGTTTGTTANTYAYYRSAATPTVAGEIMANNIFVNKRSGGTTGNHYAFRMQNAADYSNGFIASTYNLYQFGNGANNKLGYVGADIADFSAFQTACASFYTGCINADPEFMNPTAATPDLRIMLNSSVVNAVGTAVASITDDYFGSTRTGLTPTDIGAHAYTPAVITTSASDYFRTTTTGNWNSNATWSSSTNNTEWATATLTPTSTAASVLIQNGHEVTVTANATASALTVQGGAKLTLNDTYTLNATSLSLQSDATNGTATVKDMNAAGGLTVSGATTAQQYLTIGRNWYVASPVASATSAVFDAASSATNKLWYYSETTGTSAPWAQITDNSTSLTPGKGYVANMPSNGVVTFSGALNTGALTTATLTRTTGQTAEGFNLVGNPYASYLDWNAVTKTNVMPTMWYRTKVGGVYKFYTYLNGTGALEEDGITVPAGVSNLIPPMQGFWVRVASGQTTGSISVTNAMRAHKDASGNIMKAPAAKKSALPLLRLQLSDGVNDDETVIYFSQNVSNGLDTYDASKMFITGNTVPEIYTTVAGEKLAINGLNNDNSSKVVALGLKTGDATSLSIRATEVKNLDSNTRIILINNKNNAETDITDGGAYTFDTDAINASNPFTVVFRAAGVSTGVDKSNADNISVVVNKQNQIELFAPANSSYGVYNLTGQCIVRGVTASNRNTLNNILLPGVYVVKVANNFASSVVIK